MGMDNGVLQAMNQVRCREKQSHRLDGVRQDGERQSRPGEKDQRQPQELVEDLGFLHGVALDLNALSALTFEPVDHERFPCVGFAYQALQAGGTYPAVLNAANEVAVDLFLSGRVTFPDIPALIAKAMDRHRGRKIDSLEDALDADREARRLVF